MGQRTSRGHCTDRIQEECTDGDFLLQVTKETTRRDAVLHLILTSKKHKSRGPDEIHQQVLRELELAGEAARPLSTTFEKPGLKRGGGET